MSTLAVVEFVTLDGVMQGFHQPDDRNGFRHSGWGGAYADETQFRAAVEELPATEAYVLGRRTYDELAQFWPHQPDENPMAAHLNRTPKYVATRSDRPLTWSNSHRLDGDLVAAVASLRRDVAGRIVVLGSGDVVGQLFAGDLVDEVSLFVHPLVLGSGRRLLPPMDEPIRLHLERVVPTSTGVLMVDYSVER